MQNVFNTSCLAGYDCNYKESRNFVTIKIKTKQDREDVYFQVSEFVASQNCGRTRILNQNISSQPYLLING